MMGFDCACLNMSVLIGVEEQAEYSFPLTLQIVKCQIWHFVAGLFNLFIYIFSSNPKKKGKKKKVQNVFGSIPNKYS